MLEPENRPVSRPAALGGRLGTPRVAFIGWTLFVSGLFVLAATGAAYPVRTHLLIFAGAVLVSAPVGALMLAVAGSEALVHRAWASGFRRLDTANRGLPPTLARGLRYAGVIWAANGCALWFATVVGAI